MERACLIFFYLSFVSNFMDIFVSTVGFGGCPDTKIMRGFNLSGVGGMWYEVERSFYFMESGTKCTSLKLIVKDTNRIEVIRTTYDHWLGIYTRGVGFAEPSYETPSTLYYIPRSKIISSFAGLLPSAGTYTILYTDYTNYMILWSCSDLALVNVDQIWIFARKRQYGVTLQSRIYKVLNALNIDTDRLTASKNTNCAENKLI